MNGTIWAKKPGWLNKKVNLTLCQQMKSLLKEWQIYTVCEQARCPNISDCFSKGIVTFMILGDVCTRSCKFCNIRKNQLRKEVNFSEPQKIAEAVKALKLRYVVITSPCRDDLVDGGAFMFSQTIKELKKLNFIQGIEVLIPDFAGDAKAIEKVVKVSPTVVTHNIETVPSLYPSIRKEANYKRSLNVLKQVKQINPYILTKSGIMLGLGEKKEEVIDVLQALRMVSCDFLTIGQYLAPSLSHWPVKRYISPQEFVWWKEVALKLGFKKVLSGPYVRSSYQAEQFLEVDTKNTN